VTAHTTNATSAAVGGDKKAGVSRLQSGNTANLPHRSIAAIQVVVVVGAAVGLLVRSEQGTPAMVTLLCVGAAALGMVLVIARPHERRMLAMMYGAALGLRAAVAVGVYYWDPLFFSLDQVSYFNQGVALAARWHVAGSGPSFDWLAAGPGSLLAEANRFPEMWAVLSYFVGPSELAMRMSVAVVGAYTAVRFYRLGQELFGEIPGRWAGWLAACWPSLIIWSAQGLRDPLLVWLWCEVGIGVLRVCRGPALKGTLGLSLAIYGFSLLRPYAAVVAGRGIAIALLLATLRGAKGGKLLAVGVVGFTLLMGGLGFYGTSFLAGADLELATEIHKAFEGGGSSFAAGVDLSSYRAVARYLPVGASYFWLAPFFWQRGSALQMSSLIEQPLWYGMLLLAGWGVMSALRRRVPAGLALLAVVVPATAFYVVVMSNVGTAYRSRAQFLPYVFVYSAEGIVAWKARRSRRRAPVASTGQLHHARVGL